MPGLLSPKEIVEYAAHYAEQKNGFSFKKLAMLSFLAGVYIAMGGLLSLMAAYGIPELGANNPALVKLLMGATFPLGLILVVLAGAELFTGNTAYFIPAAMQGKVKWSGVLRNWSLVWVGNFVGALFFMYFFVHLTGVLNEECWIDGANSIAAAKTSKPFFITLLKGIAANWFVCLAMWLGMSSKTTGGKIIGMWWPVMAFVAIGYEHSIANMFFLPLAMLNGSDVTVSELFFSNLIPATLGNIIGGALFVGGLYWAIYLKPSNQK